MSLFRGCFDKITGWLIIVGGSKFNSSLVICISVINEFIVDSDKRCAYKAGFKFS